MLSRSVAYQSTGGSSLDGGHDLVGISWKPINPSHPSASIIVTCAHQVIVYKPGESRRSHQWSFKPSDSTAFSHATVFLPASSRYVGVQCGGKLVTWFETDVHIKRPPAVKAEGPVHGVHASPELGDLFVVVLRSGEVGLYHGSLKSVGACSAVGDEGGDVGGEGGDGSIAGLKWEVVWSGLREKVLLVLERRGESTRVRTYVVSVPRLSRREGLSLTKQSGEKVAAPSLTAAHGGADLNVALVSSHLLPRPTCPLEESMDRGVEVEAQACSATFLDDLGPGFLAVAWRSPRGPFWTKLALSADGVREEFSRPVGVSRVTPVVVPDSPQDITPEGDGTKSSKKSRRPPKTKKAPLAGTHDVVVGSMGSSDAGHALPSIVAADGNRVLVHSGGTYPQLACWDAVYGVLLDESEAPERSSDAPSSPRAGKGGRTEAVSMALSRNGAYLGVAAGGGVIVCGLPVQESSTLASLLRRKRPSVGGALDTARVSEHLRTATQSAPSVDLKRNARAAQILCGKEALAPGKWEAEVIDPSREAELTVIRSLEAAARERNGYAFKQILLKALGENSAVESRGGDYGRGSMGRFPPKKFGRKRKGGKASLRRHDSPNVLSAAVELCLRNPGANLWGALGLLLRSGGVSARHHRGLVAVIVEHGPAGLLEEVMLHVADLPETDAVRIVRYLLSVAAAIVDEGKEPASVELGVEETAQCDAGEPEAKRRMLAAKWSRGHLGKRPEGAEVKGDENESAAKVSDESPGDVVRKRRKPNLGTHEAAMGETEGGVITATVEEVVVKSKGKDGFEDACITASNPHKGTNGVVANGHHYPSLTGAHEIDGGTSSESGGASEGEGVVEQAGNAHAGDADSGGDVNKEMKGARDKWRGTRPRNRFTLPPSTHAALRAERALRVALTLPYNEAFLRSALAELCEVEVVIVLKILTRILLEGRIAENVPLSQSMRRSWDPFWVANRGLPAARTQAVLGWAAAVVDAHFTPLAMGGYTGSSVLGVLRALERVTKQEMRYCESLFKVQSLLDEARRRQAAVQQEARRHSERELYTIQELRF